MIDETKNLPDDNQPVEATVEPSSELNPRYGKGLWTKYFILLLMVLVGFVVAVFGSVLLGVLTTQSREGILCTNAIQDFFVFILPALICAVMFSHRPWRSLRMDKAPRWVDVLTVVAVAALSLPAMNYIVELNKAMSLPESLSGLEQWMRSAEDTAEVMTKQLLDFTSPATFVWVLLVVAVLAGLSEEVLFRGSMLGMAVDAKRNKYVWIWIVAIVFSAFHFQFYGFVPRMLLGAWFGYLMVKTESLWVPIIGHVLNNGVVVVASYLSNIGVIVNSDAVDNLGVPAAGQFPWLACASAIVTLAVVICWWKKRKSNE